MKELIKLANEENFITENGTILSTDLVKIINEFRKIEQETNGKTYKELKHRDFMKKIRNELKTLESVGLNNGGNFSPVEYEDKKGEKRPCYELSKEGMLMMLNSESTIVRYYTIEKIKQLEEKLKETEKVIKHYEKKPYDYGVSPLFMEKRSGDSNATNFLNNAVRRELEAIINKTGIKATFFAQQLNISDSNMSNWRNNAINFNEEKINNLLDVLDTVKGVLLLS